MKYVSIDLEMTGLDSTKHDILEFGAIIDDLEFQLPLDKLPRFHVYFCKDHFVGEAGALSMHSRLFKIIDEKNPNHKFVFNDHIGKPFKNFLLQNGYELKNDKVNISVAGKCFGTFDLQFLKNRTDFCSHIKVNSRILDPAILYYEKGDKKLPDLKTCLERTGVPSNVNHTAMSDALDVVKLIRFKLGIL